MAGPEQYQLDHQYRMQRLRVVQQALLYFTMAAFGCFACYCMYLCVRELAGRQTTASILLSLYATLRAPRALAILLSYVLTGGTTIWAVGERKSKKKLIARTHPLIRDAQRSRDPGKGSSNITLEGNTKPEDL
jgi:hypothetical protein